nr:dienelactone hydrolase family protein [Demequina sp. TTPB684]
MFHSALGLTRHVRDWAQAIGADGHDVLLPDLFGGVTFADVDDAVTHVDAEGMDHWIEVARSRVARLEGPRVYAGFSLGGAIAQALALTDPHARGLVSMHSAANPAWWGVTAWPSQLTAQVHVTEADPWVEAEDLSAFTALADGSCELFEYPGEAHLFGFEGWHEYDSELSHRMFERVTEFVAEFD